MRRSAILITLLSVLFVLLPGAFAADQQTLTIDEAEAEAFALRIQDLVSKGNTSELKALLNKDRFMKRVLIGYDSTSERLRAVARGAGRSFETALLFDIASLQVKEGGDFVFVKLHQRNGEPVLQFRQVTVSGDLLYFDLYIFRTEGGKIGIEDFFLYDVGQPLSELAMDLANNGFPEDLSPELTRRLQKAVELSKEGKLEDSCPIFESLSNDIKQRRIIMRVRVNCALQLGSKNAEGLIAEHKLRFPDDTGIVFARLTAALVKDDLNGAARLIDDVYKIVAGDDFLFTYKVYLLIPQKKYKETIELLSKMETEHDIDVISLLNSMSPEDRKRFKSFFASKEYTTWLRQRRRR